MTREQTREATGVQNIQEAGTGVGYGEIGNQTVTNPGGIGTWDIGTNFIVQ